MGQLGQLLRKNFNPKPNGVNYHILLLDGMNEHEIPEVDTVLSYYADDLTHDKDIHPRIFENLMRLRPSLTNELVAHNLSSTLEQMTVEPFAIYKKYFYCPDGIFPMEELVDWLERFEQRCMDNFHHASGDDDYFDYTPLFIYLYIDLLEQLGCAEYIPYFRLELYKNRPDYEEFFTDDEVKLFESLIQ